MAGTRAPPIVSTISRLETWITILQEPGAAAALAHGKNDLKETRFIDSDVYLQSRVKLDLYLLCFIFGEAGQRKAA